MEATALPRRRGRPPRAPDSHAQTREQLIRAGVAALTEQGFTATGLDGLLRGAGIPKGSFYYYFDSKEAFGLELIDRYAAYFAARLDRSFGQAQVPPLERLRHFVADAAAGMARHDFRRGCLIGNLGQELAVLPQTYRQALSAVLASWEARLATCLADQYGQVTARRYAAFFWTGWEGAVLRARLERSARPLHLFMDGFAAMAGR
ncbi:acrylate utilization transcriptional regulator AcuR [Gluconacetobacter takamatsuzukensis]|uniref:TetR family transcriptional regulator n=1 Tax=Gluconacetobacter takamatsuzukensis TaxID=1286190 RepID=A0A7W4PPC1_9PROT|nr:TetR/AcrR family transcriptional regulator [Gluconacetobacter takamatsuzukensis]MBB2205477.1 TetR family transcriptional regulator [Gluconacetobacter takamatsuzukensis]